MNNTLDHKCPKCDAVLKFNPESQNWKCEYCRSKFNLEDLNTIELNKEVSSEIDVYTCQNCGAEILADANTSATFCIYCKNTAILKNKLEGAFNPDYLIPFKTTKEDAIKAFKKHCKGKWLMPKAFNMKKNIKEISGIYVPFWLYNLDSTGEIEVKCEKISEWKSGDYNYKKIDTYKAIRGGNISFENIPVDGSKKFENDILNSIEPYNYEELKGFNYSYLSGFLSEKYDLNEEESVIDANTRARNSFIEEMKSDITGYDSKTLSDNSINIYNSKSSYVLLPVWFLNIKYKDKMYTFAMNGQTGKIVGNIPVDIKKAIFIWIGLFLIIFIFMLLLNIFSLIILRGKL
ncbi:MAG: DNA helicase PriA [Bacilli bacterium]|nr:DNA helicase PriA [Bacilli bacterium]